MKKSNGFTLIELLAVIAILALLVLMALPAILRMYRSASISIFENEVKNVYKAAQTQFISYSATLDANGRFTYENETNPLEMIENRNLKYCIVIDINGRIKNINVSNGKYSYSKSGSDLKIGNIDVENSNDIELESDNTENICRNAPIITFVNRQNAGQITAGDEVAIRSEHFYVVSSDATTTVLLAKYDLKPDGNGSYMQDTSGTDTNIVKVNFLDSNNMAYWDNRNCTYDGSWSCPRAGGLKSEYANPTNEAGARDYAMPYPEVYDSNAVNIYPVVQSYANKIATEVGISITGKLMTREQANYLSKDVRKDLNGTNGTYYWLGCATWKNSIWAVNSSGDCIFNILANKTYGVRPVIEIPTSEI